MSNHSKIDTTDTINQGQVTKSNVTGTTVGEKRLLDVNQVNGLALDGVNRDYVKRTDPDTVTEVYIYRLGGASGDITEVVTIVYTDATKCILDYAGVD